jgi:hypothetical protein
MLTHAPLRPAKAGIQFSAKPPRFRGDELRIADAIETSPFRRPENLSRCMEGLRLARITQTGPQGSFFI